MTAPRRLQILSVAVVAGLHLAAGIAQPAGPLVTATPGVAGATEAAAEAALKNCQLEQSLRLWREILAADPIHERARFVVTGLTAQALDLDSHLAVIQTLIEQKATDDVHPLLDAASRRAATDTQKARILYLRGRLARELSQPGRARANFEAAGKLFGDSDWAGRSAIALAEMDQAESVPARARRLLSAVGENRQLSASVREEAALKLLLMDSSGWTSRRQVAALGELLGDTTDDAVKRRILSEIVRSCLAAQGQWTPEAVEAAGAILDGDPPHAPAGSILNKLSSVAARSQDPSVLDALLKVLAEVKLKDAPLARRAALARADALISRAVVDDDAATVKRRLAGAGEALDRLAAADPTPADTEQIRRLRGRALLAEAQKLIALSGPAEALPAVTKAKAHYLAALPADPAGALAQLQNIGRLLEHVGQWHTAIDLYRQIARQFPHMAEAADALLRVAEIYEQRLNAPTAALEVYAEYAGRYPAELPYRQLDVGRRLRRLGYANVLDFQKRNGLDPDGAFGPNTRRKLEQLEESFDVIRLASPGRDTGVIRGRFVHPTMFAIARRLQVQGRHHDAIRAHLLLLNLFPTKKQADDALLAVARGLRDNLLFEEALGAYTELIEYFPKGNATSAAYVEAAACLENLGRWKQAGELYELYLKKFPRYRHAGLCAARIKLLDEVQQYQEFLAANGAAAKAPEAQYQIGVILYKRLGNHTKAAVELAKVADNYPKHVRAADGLFTAGAAHLRTENFPAARAVFAKLAADYPQSRLADDAQYWIGHTHEYAARALGKLDARRIVLRRRAGRQRESLLADMQLRRRYHPQARPGEQMPDSVWTTDALGVLTSGSKRDRVNAELFRAIAAYRAVVAKFKMGDMAGKALHRVGEIYTNYLNDPEKGFQAYQELLTNYPGTTQAVNALYEVGAYRLHNKDFAQAVKCYRQFVYNYPTDKRAQDAMLAIARCHMESKAYDKALDAYQSYLSKFPAGRGADFAKAQITWIRTYHY